MRVFPLGKFREELLFPSGPAWIAVYFHRRITSVKYTDVAKNDDLIGASVINICGIDGFGADMTSLNSDHNKGQLETAAETNPIYA